MESAYILFGIALLSIILGFIALLRQKTYLDPTTKEPTEVEVPFLGKIKTNYPALVFVFLGSALAFYAFQKSFPPPKEEWTLKGRFTPPDSKTVDPTGTLTLFQDAVFVRNTIDTHGRFEIAVNIPQGKSVEDVFESLIYTYSDGGAEIDLRKEYKAFLKQQPSKIENATEHGRIFKPVPITVFQ